MKLPYSSKEDLILVARTSLGKSLIMQILPCLVSELIMIFLPRVQSKLILFERVCQRKEGSFFIFVNSKKNNNQDLLIKAGIYNTHIQCDILGNILSNAQFRNLG